MVMYFLDKNVSRIRTSVFQENFVNKIIISSPEPKAPR